MLHCSSSFWTVQFAQCSEALSSNSRTKNRSHCSRLNLYLTFFLICETFETIFEHVYSTAQLNHWEWRQKYITFSNCSFKVALSWLTIEYLKYFWVGHEFLHRPLEKENKISWFHTFISVNKKMKKKSSKLTKCTHLLSLNK